MSDYIACLNLLRMRTWRRRGPEATWPFSPDSATQQRASTAWKPSQLPSRLLTHRWAFLSRVCKIIGKTKRKCLTQLWNQIPTGCVQVHGPASQHVSSSTMTVSPPKAPVLSRRPVVEDYQHDYRKEALRKSKCLSIGIQVLTGRRLRWRQTRD